MYSNKYQNNGKSYYIKKSSSNKNSFCKYILNLEYMLDNCMEMDVVNIKKENIGDISTKFSFIQFHYNT